MTAAPPTTHRLDGLDLARGLAVVGMVLVNFMYVFSHDPLTQLDAGLSPAHEPSLVGIGAALLVFTLLAGRAVAIFLVLFGIGISLQSRRAQGRGQRAWRSPLVARYLLLILVGLALLPVWEADILHFIGFFGLLSLMVVRLPSRVLLAGCVVLLLAAEVLRLQFDYHAGWQAGAVGSEYLDLWTATGQLRQLVFNGYHPLFPWWSYVLYGMVLGRLDLRSPRILRRLVWAGIVVTVDGSILQWLGVPAEFFPPHSLFVVLGMANATWVIAACLWLCTSRGGGWLRDALRSMGRLAFTHYPGHVLLGILPVMVLRSERMDMTLQNSFFLSLFYLGSTLLLGSWWLNHHPQGPLEGLLRRWSLRLSQSLKVRRAAT